MCRFWSGVVRCRYGDAGLSAVTVLLYVNLGFSVQPEVFSLSSKIMAWDVSFFVVSVVDKKKLKKFLWMGHYVADSI
jgi:hypothetical protein